MRKHKTVKKVTLSDSGMTRPKAGSCERCTRPIINVRGRCLPCNYFYKHKRYYRGLKSAPKYDFAQGLDPSTVGREIERARVVPRSKIPVRGVVESDKPTLAQAPVLKKDRQGAKPLKKYAPINMFREFKSKYPTHIIFIQCGRFYEVFGEDANECHRLFGWKTIKKCGVDWTGTPTWSPNFKDKLKSLNRAYIIVDQIIEDGYLKRQLAEKHPPKLITVRRRNIAHTISHKCPTCVNQDVWVGHTEAILLEELRRRGIPCKSQSCIRTRRRGNKVYHTDLSIEPREEQQVVIEVQGPAHYEEPAQMAFDEERRKDIEHEGYSFIIVRNEDLRTDRIAVGEYVVQELKRIKQARLGPNHCQISVQRL